MTSKVRKLKTKEEISILVENIKSKLDDLKALDIEVIDVSDKTDICYYMIIASGTSNRHVSAVADKTTRHIKHEIKDLDYRIEGTEEGKWVLIDCYDIVIHIFQQELRDVYDLEELWNKKR